MISIKTSKLLCVSLAVIGFMTAASQAAATVFSIDNFSISRTRDVTTTTIFEDNFNNNIAPANPPYFITGAIGTESAGRYRFDTATGGITPSASGLGDVRLTSARFNPVVTNEATNLRNTDIFTVTGIFDLIVPENIREGYGIRLNDAGIPSTTTNTNDRLELLVRRTIDNVLSIQFRDADSSQFVVTLINEALLETNHDQVVLQLSKLDAAVNAITARFAYVDNGIVGTFFDFAGSGTLFDGENFTRAEFRATTPVPIPATLFLSLLGLVAMGFVRKQRA